MGVPLPWVWSWDPQVLIGLALAAGLYTIGLRYSQRMGLRRTTSGWHVAAFFLGLLGVYVAWESPLETWSHLYLTAHMIQSELLLFVAAPLLVLSAPLLPLWRAAPLAGRQESLRWGLRHPRLRRALFAIGRFFARPLVVWVLFVANFLVWHVPQISDAALGNYALFGVEHLFFLATGLLFWSQLIASPPVRPRMNSGIGALYLFGATAAIMVVAIELIFDPTPIYAYYTIHHLPGAPDAVLDQASAGALMNVSVGTICSFVFCLLLWKWLENEERNASSLPPAGLKVRPIAPPIQPTFRGKALRWKPVVLQGGLRPPDAVPLQPPDSPTGTTESDTPDLSELRDMTDQHGDDPSGTGAG